MDPEQEADLLRKIAKRDRERRGGLLDTSNKIKLAQAAAAFQEAKKKEKQLEKKVKLKLAAKQEKSKKDKRLHSLGLCAKDPKKDTCNKPVE